MKFRLEVKTLNDKELKVFIINFINRKEKESENKDYIEYSYYELKVKANLSEKQIDEVLRVSRDYFENHSSIHSKLLVLPHSLR